MDQVGLRAPRQVFPIPNTGTKQGRPDEQGRKSDEYDLYWQRMRKSIPMPSKENGLLGDVTSGNSFDIVFKSALEVVGTSTAAKREEQNNVFRHH